MGVVNLPPPTFENKTRDFSQCVSECTPLKEYFVNCNLVTIPVAGSSFSTNGLNCFCRSTLAVSGFLLSNASNPCSTNCSDAGWDGVRIQTAKLCNSSALVTPDISLSIASASTDSSWTYITITPTLVPITATFTSRNIFVAPTVYNTTTAAIPSETRIFPTGPGTQPQSPPPPIPPFAIALIPIFVLLALFLLAWALLKRRLKTKTTRPFSRTFHRMSDSHSSPQNNHPSILAYLTSNLSRHRRTHKFEIDSSDRAELETIEHPQELPSSTHKSWQILRLLSFHRPKSPLNSQQAPQESTAAARAGSRRTRSRRPSNKTTATEDERKTHAAAQAAGISDHLSFETSVMASMAARAQVDEEIKSLRAEQGRIWAEREAIEMRELEVVDRIWRREREREEGTGQGVRV